MILDEVATYLTSTGVAAGKVPGSTSTLAFTVFKSFMPDQPDKVIVLYERQGDAPFDFIGQPSLQVRVRGAPHEESATTYSDARSAIESVRSALHALKPQTLSPAYYGGLWAEQDPFSVGLDDNDRPELVCNFRALRVST